MIRVTMLAIFLKDSFDPDQKRSKKACTEVKKTLKDMGIKMKNPCVSESGSAGTHKLVFWAEPSDMFTIYEVGIAQEISNIEFEYSDTY